MILIFSFYSLEDFPGRKSRDTYWLRGRRLIIVVCSARLAARNQLGHKAEESFVRRRREHTATYRRYRGRGVH